MGLRNWWIFFHLPVRAVKLRLPEAGRLGRTQAWAAKLRHPPTGRLAVTQASSCTTTAVLTLGYSLSFPFVLNSPAPPYILSSLLDRCLSGILSLWADVFILHFLCSNPRLIKKCDPLPILLGLTWPLFRNVNFQALLGRRNLVGKSGCLLN